MRFGAALALALVLCATAALAAETGGKRLVPVGHTVGVKLFSRGHCSGEAAGGQYACPHLRPETGDVIEACGGRTVTSTEQFQSLAGKRYGHHGTVRQAAGSPADALGRPERNEEGACCIGACVQDSMAGIGTVTLDYDPDNTLVPWATALRTGTPPP